MELIVGIILIPIGSILLYFGVKETNKKDDMIWIARNGINIITLSIGLISSGFILIYNYFN